ncbi:MAG: hypothetical protein ACI4I3_09025, partial [Acutalibacteraceae bacterium]
MKNNTEKDKHLEILTFIVSVALTAAICFSHSAGRLSLAMAGIMFSPVVAASDSVSAAAESQTSAADETAETTISQTEVS